MLKSIYKTKDEIPAEYVSLFTERNGQWEMTQVEGIKTLADVERVQVGATTERTDHAATKAKLKVYTDAFGDKTVEDINKDLDRIPELEAKATGDGPDQDKIDNLVDARVRREMAPITRENETLKTANADLTASNTTFTAKDLSRTIRDGLRAAGVEQKMEPGAMEDLLMYEGSFEIDAAGAIVTKEGSPFTVGMEPGAFVTDMKEKRPHWWGVSAGGGAGGNLGGANNGENPFSHKHWNLTKQGHLTTSDRPKAEQLAKAAGTTISGIKPAAPAT